MTQGMKLGRWLPLAVFAALAALMAAGVWLSRKPDRDVLPSTLIGKPAPRFALPVLHEPGRVVTLDDLKGQPFLVNVWGSWCPTCREEHPVLTRFADTKRVRVVGIDWKDDRADALQWLEQFGNPYWLVLSDEQGGTVIDFGVAAAPETFLVDAHGVEMIRTPDTTAPRPRGRLIRLVLAAVATVALVGTGFGLAAASIPGPNGVIHGCYVKKTGALRVIGTGACPAGTVAISWNQKGPRGLRGYTGAKGVKGDTGAAGSALGWATISSSGTIYTSGGSLGAPTVTHPSTGLYCITGTGWVQQGGPYSLSLINSGSGGQVTLNPYFWGSGCNAAGYNITVSTFNASGTLTDEYFMIAKLG